MKKHLLLIVLQLAASGNDAYWTHHNLTSSFKNHREFNPIARPFVKSTGGLVVYFSGDAALKLTLPVLLRKHNHAKLATAAQILGIADNSIGGTISAFHSHEQR